MSIDYERLEQITDGDAAVKLELLGLYFNTVKRCLPIIQNLAPEHDGEWRDAVHELKGASNTLGFERVGNLCQQVERLKSIAMEGKHAILIELEEALAEIKDYQKSLGE